MSGRLSQTWNGARNETGKKHLLANMHHLAHHFEERWHRDGAGLAPEAGALETSPLDSQKERTSKTRERQMLKTRDCLSCMILVLVLDGG